MDNSLTSYSSNLRGMPASLLDLCRTKGLTEEQNRRLSAHLVLFEATEAPENSLNAQTAAELIENLRTGGRLLLTLNPYPGHGVFWLSSVLPSTGWTSQVRPSEFSPKKPIPVFASDQEFFSSMSIDGLQVPPGIDIRPVSAAERGQARYERYRLQHPYLKTDIPPNTDLWSRPLLNREWIVRASYKDIARLPLLVTGRYGAGKIAMLATTATAVGDSVAAQSFWHSVINWLMATDSSPAYIPTRNPSLAISFPSPKTVRLTINNPSAEPLPAQLILRILNRDGAMLANGAAELRQPLTLIPSRQTVLQLPLSVEAVSGIKPEADETMLQVRAGLLSSDGSMLLAEQRSSSAPPAFCLEVAADNLYAKPSPFPGPKADALDGFSGRMGLAVCAYAYKPGTVLHGTVTLSHERTNLAPFALIRDLTQPANLSVMALNDRATGMRRTPGDHVEGYGMWTGKRGVDNALQFTLRAHTRLAAIVLVGSFANGEMHNPARALVELEGRLVASVDDLDTAFISGLGQARITLPPALSGKEVTVRFPWVNEQGARPRYEPWLGEILLEGWEVGEAPAAPPLSGQLTVDLVDALGGQRVKILDSRLMVPSGELQTQGFSVSLPDGIELGIYRLEALFHPAAIEAKQVISTTPVLVVAPRRTLKPLADLTGPHVFGTAMIVTNGFTKFFQLGTGTAESWNGWGHPDDLVWAYSRQFKEIPPNAHTAANRLYASETDMRHYSIPWREFSNGELFFPTAVGGLVNYLKAQPGWDEAPVVRLTFGDRWVIGPDLRSCNSWQEYVAFDSHLRETTGKGLDGHTHSEVETCIHNSHETEWQSWQLGRYVRSVNAVREAFRSAGKDVFIYSQGFPLVAGEQGRELARTIRGMNDDFTWGMQDNSPMLTTGRHLGELAFNPVWQAATLMTWGFVSPVFNNWQWHNPVSTSEPVRRMLYNRTWRGMIWDGGRYGALATYGFGNNVGTAYTMTKEEYQQWWYLQQRGNLLQPESPLGAGLVISTQKDADPQSIRWNCGDPTSLPEPRLMMKAFRSLSEAGVSLPFATNASTLTDWTPTPGASLIVLNLSDFSDTEITSLARLQSRGVRIAAFAQPTALSSAASVLFSHPGTLLIERSVEDLTHPQAMELATQLLNALEVPIRFSDGLAGYGFRCYGLSLIVVEDWLEQARIGSVHLRKSPGAAHASATNLNDHSTLAVTDDGAFWAVALPMRSGDGTLLAIREA